MAYRVNEDGWMQMMYAWGLLHCGECGEVELQRALELARAHAKPIEEFRATSQLRFFGYHTLAAAQARAGSLIEAIKSKQDEFTTDYNEWVCNLRFGMEKLNVLLDSEQLYQGKFHLNHDKMDALPE